MYITLPYDTIKTTDLLFQYSCTDQQGRDPEDPAPPTPFEKNVVQFMKQIKKHMYIHVVKTKHTYNNERFVYYLPIKIIIL